MMCDVVRRAIAVIRQSSLAVDINLYIERHIAS